MLTGEGRGFSSGQDLTEDLPRDAEGRIDLGPPLARDYNPLMRRLAEYPKVTIAALNGPAVGASMNIALACDIVVAARSAYLQEAFARIALDPGCGRHLDSAPTRRAQAGPRPDADGGARSRRGGRAMGLVYKVFEDAAFRAETAALAARLAHGPALAYRLTKRAVRRKSLQRASRRSLTLRRRCSARPASR